MYRHLADKGLLVEHEEVGAEQAMSGGVAKVIRPVLIPVITYPYEWCVSQLQRAALLVLALEAAAVEFGMTLKDASAYNVQFRGANPLLIDTLSFEVYEERSLWKPYLQFCRHFLAPLALMSTCDARAGQLLRAYTDGIPLDLACSLLPLRSRFKPGLFMHLFLHARAERTPMLRRPAREHEISKRSRLGLIESLRRTVEGLSWKASTPWSDYADNDSYTAEGARHKEQLTREFVARVRPHEVWDFGANVGAYSRIASEQRIVTVAWDSDYGSVELNYRRAVQDNDEYLVAAVTDLTNPSPANGWAHTERQSFRERCRADLLLSLALIHHLSIAGGIPFGQIAEFFASLAPWLVVEFVGRDDPKAAQMLTTRGDVHPYTQEAFEQAFREQYEIIECARIRDSERTLYLMKRCC